MELARILRELKRHKLLVIAAFFVSFYIGASMAYQIGPSGVKSKSSLSVGAAMAQVLVDSEKSSLVDLNQQILPLSERAAVLAQFMKSGPVVEQIAKDMGISPNLVATQGPYAGASNASTGGELPAGASAAQLAQQSSPYRLLINPELSPDGSTDLPILTIYSEAPSAALAIKLADSAVAAVNTYIAQLADTINVAPTNRLKLTSLGPATGGLVNPGAGIKTAMLVTVGLFCVFLVLIVVISGLLRNLKQARLIAAEAEAEAAGSEVHSAANGNGHARVAEDVHRPEPSVDATNGRKHAPRLYLPRATQRSARSTSDPVDAPGHTSERPSRKFVR